MGDRKEFFIKYGGSIALISSGLLLFLYIAVTIASEGYSAKFKDLASLNEEVQLNLQQKDYEEGQGPTTDFGYLGQIQKDWEKAGIATKTHNFKVYPVLGVGFVNCDTADQEKIKDGLGSDFLHLGAQEMKSYWGPKVSVIRQEAKQKIKAVPAVLLSVDQEDVNKITLRWKDDDSNPNQSIEKCGLEEYQVYRVREGEEEPERISPSGYQEQVFIDSSVQALTEYRYYVVTIADSEKVTQTEEGNAAEAPPSNSISIRTASDVGVIFYSIIGGAGASLANVDVYKFHQGNWYKKSFPVKPGDVIGKPAKIKIEGTRVELDFTTPYEVYEYDASKDRIFEKDGKEVVLKNHPRLVYFDKSEGRRLKTIWKFHALYDENPYSDKNRK